MTAVFSLLLLPGSTKSLMNLHIKMRHFKGFLSRQNCVNICCSVILYLRVTLSPLDVAVGQISAGTDCDLKTGGVGVVGQSQLQLSSHSDALKEAAIGVDAAVTTLREQNTGKYMLYLGPRAQSKIRYFNHRMLFFIFTSSVSTYSLPSRILRAKGCFFFCPGGVAFLVAVFVFLEQVRKTRAFDELRRSFFFEMIIFIIIIHQLLFGSLASTS